MIRLIVVGKIKEQYLVNMIDDYCKRINKYHKLEILEIPDSNPKLETEKIIKKIENAYNVALDINGEEFGSVGFAKFIEQTLMHKANINFIIGGSDGLNSEVITKCDKRISFGKITFPHGLFRAILLEQIYRSFKILNNETYHK